MEAESETAEGRGRRKEREAAAGHAVVGMEVDAGARAAEEGEVEGGGADADADAVEEAAAAEEDGRGGGGGFVGYDAIDWMRGEERKQRHPHPQLQLQPRTPGLAGSRAPWRGMGRGWSGRGGVRHQHRPWNPQHHHPDTFNKPSGAIILCNRAAKWQSFQHKLFALPGYAASFIKKIRAGMLLFVFEREQRKLYGVLEATSDGELNIVPNAFPSMRKPLPAQIRFRRVWFCRSLAEAEFSDSIKGLQPHMSFFGLSYQQVLNLVHLFAPKRIRLQPYQKPISRVICDYKFSLAHTGLESHLHTASNVCASCSSPMFCNNRISLPHSFLMYTKQNVKRAAYRYESPLQSQPKSVIFEAPDIKAKKLEPDVDYIPLELVDDCKSDSDAVLSDVLGTVNFCSTLLGSIDNEDQDPKPFNGKCNEDGCHSPVLNPRFIAESEECQNIAIAHIREKCPSSMQSKGCKRKFQCDEYSVLPSPRRCIMERGALFDFGDEVSVTSAKVSQKPAVAEQNREAVIEERKQDIGCLIHDIQRMGRDVSAKSKLMGLPFPEGLTKQLVQSCSRNSKSLVTQSGIKLTYTLLTDDE